MEKVKLKDAYPTLFRTASHKNATVVDLWEREIGRCGCWEDQFRRPLQDWEMEEVTRFFGAFSSIKSARKEHFNLER